MSRGVDHSAPPSLEPAGGSHVNFNTTELKTSGSSKSPELEAEELARIADGFYSSYSCLLDAFISIFLGYDLVGFGALLLPISAFIGVFIVKKHQEKSAK